jgi:hypothetical protein
LKLRCLSDHAIIEIMTKRRTEDFNEAAFRVVSESTSEHSASKEKNPAAVSLGRLGGLKGGKARARALPASKRKAIAKKAAKARWSKAGIIPAAI